MYVPYGDENPCITLDHFAVDVACIMPLQCTLLLYLVCASRYARASCSCSILFVQTLYRYPRDSDNCVEVYSTPMSIMCRLRS